MKLSIKTEYIEIEYQDDYSKIEKEVKERIEDVIKKVYEYELQLESIRTKDKHTKKHESHN